MVAPIIFFAIVFFVILFQVVFDLFRDHELSGWAKAGWLIFIIVLPFLGLFIYLIVRGQGMADRSAKDQVQAKQEFDPYVRETAGSGRRQRDRQRQAAPRRGDDLPGGVRRASSARRWAEAARRETTAVVSRRAPVSRRSRPGA